MLALSAYYEGTVAGDPEEFDRHVRTVHLPLVAKYPRLRALEYNKGMPRDGAPPKFHLCFRLYFDSIEDFGIAARSDERMRAVEDAKYLASRFKGEIHHVMYEVDAIPIPTAKG